MANSNVSNGTVGNDMSAMDCRQWTVGNALSAMHCQ
jgi:hypothetical protein